MIRICPGCGSIIQSDDKEKSGYVKKELLNEENIVCERCFKLKNYKKDIKKEKIDTNKIFKKINKNDLVIYITDVLNINYNNMENPTIIILSKRDLLPKSVSDNKVISYLENSIDCINVIDIITLSSIKNYNMDRIYKLIMKYKKSKNVYIVGGANAGKSTFINRFIKNYSHRDLELTVSDIPGTTLDLISININDELTLIDTPGLISNNNVQNYFNVNELKKYIPHKEIKPIVYQLNEKQTLMIDEIIRIDYEEGEKNSFTIYMSNTLNIHRSKIDTHIKLKEEKKHIYGIEDKDIVIEGLGWIKIKKKAKISIYTKYDIKIDIREPLI